MLPAGQALLPRRPRDPPRYVARFDPLLRVWCIHHRASNYVVRFGPAYGRFSTVASALDHFLAFLQSPDALLAVMANTKPSRRGLIA